MAGQMVRKAMSSEVDTAHEEFEQELYEEPPRTTWKDTLGVLVALLALAVIGYVGYVWLTPGKTFDRVFASFNGGGESTQMAANSHEGHESSATPASASSGDEVRCDYCGMFAGRSRAHIRANWTNGTTTHHDSFDCFFNYGAEEELTLSSAEVSHYDSDPADPDWLDVTTAMYLYDTDEPVAGSMPPHVAAGSCTQCTGRLQPELGGTEMDWQQLTAQWQEQADAIGATGHVHQAQEEPPAEAQNSGDEMPRAGGHTGNGGHADMQAAPAMDASATEADAPQLHDHAMDCPYCGMLADASGTHVVVQWSDGSHTHHDSWDCAFMHGKDEGLAMAAMQVSEHGTSPENPVWLDASSAWFLYDMDKRIKMSMPPFTAAFTTRAAAEAAQPEWGGAVVDFAGLQANWE